jgi:hypothetical protein
MGNITIISNSRYLDIEPEQLLLKANQSTTMKKEKLEAGMDNINSYIVFWVANT